jgi:hypothetical protein
MQYGQVRIDMAAAFGFCVTLGPLWEPDGTTSNARSASGPAKSAAIRHPPGDLCFHRAMTPASQSMRTQTPIIDAI